MASTIKQRLRRFNGTDYDTVHLETQESQIVADYSKYMLRGAHLLRPWHDLNTITTAGMYTWTVSEAPANIPALSIGNCIILPSYDDHRTTVQIVYLGGQTRVVRHGSLDGWDAWEYDNPPLNVGVEYRTTERYNGAVVYKKLVELGRVENGVTKMVKYSDVWCTPISVIGGNLNGCSLQTGTNWCLDASEEMVTELHWNFSAYLQWIFCTMTGPGADSQGLDGNGVRVIVSYCKG